jgi:predicted acetyltransferase
MQLVLPSLQYKESFLEAVKEYQKDKSNERVDILFLNTSLLQIDFQSYIAKLEDRSHGKNLPKGYVADTTYWLVDTNELIGRVSIRHELTENLLREGGHIGYDIRPAKRKNGYGKKALELALPKVKALGITKALITCDETNIGSKKIIEANGGILENRVAMGNGKPQKLRYWINL